MQQRRSAVGRGPPSRADEAASAQHPAAACCSNRAGDSSFQRSSALWGGGKEDPVELEVFRWDGGVMAGEARFALTLCPQKLPATKVTTCD